MGDVKRQTAAFQLGRVHDRSNVVRDGSAVVKARPRFSRQPRRAHVVARQGLDRRLRAPGGVLACRPWNPAFQISAAAWRQHARARSRAAPPPACPPWPLPLRCRFPASPWVHVGAALALAKASQEHTAKPDRSSRPQGAWAGSLRARLAELSTRACTLPPWEPPARTPRSLPFAGSGCTLPQPRPAPMVSREARAARRQTAVPNWGRPAGEARRAEPKALMWL